MSAKTALQIFSVHLYFRNLSILKLEPLRGGRISYHRDNRDNFIGSSPQHQSGTAVTKRNGWYKISFYLQDYVNKPNMWRYIGYLATSKLFLMGRPNTCTAHWAPGLSLTVLASSGLIYLAGIVYVTQGPSESDKIWCSPATILIVGCVISPHLPSRHPPDFIMYTVDLQDLQDFVDLLDGDLMTEIGDLGSKEKVDLFVQKLLDKQGEEGLHTFKKRAQPIIHSKCIASSALLHAMQISQLIHIIRTILSYFPPSS